MKTLDKFKLNGKVSIITGGAGLLGQKHGQAIADAGGTAILWDIKKDAVVKAAKKIGRATGMVVDITDSFSIEEGLRAVLKKYKKVDILINNACNDPKVGGDKKLNWSRLENFPLSAWQDDIAVGLTGAFLVSQIIGTHLAKNKGGVILNIASDLGIIAPDQSIYRQKGLKDHEQPVKPVTYSVIKHGIIGLTKYLATYWADKNVRVNSISPGGVYTDQSKDFVKNLTGLIPLKRMAKQDEYQAAVLFLVSDASSYMTGSNLVVDGGRTAW